MLGEENDDDDDSDTATIPFLISRFSSSHLSANGRKLMVSVTIVLHSTSPSPYSMTSL